MDPSEKTYAFCEYFDGGGRKAVLLSRQPSPVPLHGDCLKPMEKLKSAIAGKPASTVKKTPKMSNDY